MLIIATFLFAEEKAYLKEVKQLLKKHQFTKVAQLLQPYHNEPDALYYLSVVALLNGRIDEAVDLAQKGLTKSKNKDRFYEWLGDIYSVKAQTSSVFTTMMTIPKIKKNWHKAIAFNPNNLQVKEKLCLFYLMAPKIAGGDEAKASSLIKEIGLKDSLRAALLWATFYQKKNAIPKAQAQYQRALQMAPDSISVLSTVALFYLNQNQFDNARRLIEKIIHLKPRQFVGYDLLGDFYSRQNRLDSALVAYNRALEMDPFQFKIAFKKIKILAQLGKKQEARSLAEQLLKSEMFFTLRKQIESYLDQLK